MALRRAWLVPASLVALSGVPVVAGAVRLAGLVSGAAVTPGDERFHAAPLPVVLHVFGATVFSMLGALQLAPRGLIASLWHRRAGWIGLPAGLVAGLSGLWMTLFYPRAEGDGPALDALRLLFGSIMVVSLVLGIRSILKRDFAGHAAWMVRGYAVGLGAGTQVLVHLPWLLFLGKPGESVRALLMGAAWAINLAVAEWWIRRPLTIRGSGPAPARSA